jgi:CelD/BcsL family acetyltransferase involved in cellulose biosynthesis
MHILRHVDREFWLAVARQCDYATFFHTPFWHDVALGAFAQYRDATIGAVLDSGVRVVFPLLSVRLRGPWHARWTPFYGGLIADGPFTPAEAQQIYQAACGWQTSRLQLTGNPLRSDSDVPVSYESQADFTHMIALQSDFEQVFAHLPKNTRSTYRNGLRKGVQVRRATTLADCHAYYDVYQDELQRWRTKGLALVGAPYSLRQFELCYELSCQQPELAQLWLAEVDGRIAAGNWVFYWNRHVGCWQGAAHSDLLSYRPFNVLEVEIARDAVAHGYAYYDLGPSAGLEGLIAYKDSYNAERHPFSRSVYTARGVTLLHQARALLRSMRVIPGRPLNQ